jgi:hypothetical protein
MIARIFFLVSCFVTMFIFERAFSADFTYIKGPQLIQSNQTVTASSTSTIQLLQSGPMKILVTGSANQTIKLPSTASTPEGASFQIINDSTGLITVNDYLNSLVSTVLANSDKTFILFAGGFWAESACASSGTSGKILVGELPVVITQDSTTATFSINIVTDSTLTGNGTTSNPLSVVSSSGISPVIAFGTLYKSSGSPNFSSTGLGTWTEILASDMGINPSTASGSQAAKIACQSGTAPTADTCNSSGSNESIGFVTAVTSGKNYEVCFRWISGGTGGTSAYGIASTASSTITNRDGPRVQHVQGTYGERLGLGVCEIFYARYTEDRAFRLMYSSNTSSISFEMDGGVTGTNFVTWSLKEIN